MNESAPHSQASRGIWKRVVFSLLGIYWALDALTNRVGGEFSLPVLCALLGFAAPALTFLFGRIGHRVAFWFCILQIGISVMMWLDFAGTHNPEEFRFRIAGVYQSRATADGLAGWVYYGGRAALFGFAAYLVASVAPGERRPKPAVVSFRQWLLFFVLALPLVLLPEEAPSGLRNSKFDFGWPWAGMEVFIVGIPNGPFLRFYPAAELLPLVLGSMAAVGLGWRARRWALARADWRGAWAQGAVTSLYTALLFFFFKGLIEFAWVWHLFPMQWRDLENACIFARAWLPYLYVLGAMGIFTLLLLDARLRRSRQRLAHGAFALCFVLVGFWPSSYLRWQLAYLDEAIHIAREGAEKYEK